MNPCSEYHQSRNHYGSYGRIDYQIYMKRIVTLVLAAALCAAAALPASAQRWGVRTPNDTLRSVRFVDGNVIFSIYAPKARQVSIAGDGDLIPYFGENAPVVEERQDGVWTFTIKNAQPGNYRYHFIVDGIRVYDPKNELASETTAIAKVGDGSEYFAMKDVPHGAVSQRYYWSETLGCYRRMHVWTPTGYETSKKKLPVLYLIHGGGDTDNSWPGVGAAGFILDNLLAEGKMQPMIVVMPNGTIENVPNEVPPFAQDLLKSIIPFVESNYPVLTDSRHRAIAGLSMGGMETIEAAFTRPEMFSYVWVLSSGFMPGQDAAEAERLNVKQNAEKFNRSFAQFVITQGGQADIAYRNCQNTLKELDAAGVKYEYMENSQAGHCWSTWRADLYTLAQRIFK